MLHLNHIQSPKDRGSMLLQNKLLILYGATTLNTIIWETFFNNTSTNSL